MALDLPVRQADPHERADAARNRVKVLDAAERLFARHGARNVSMEAIAAEAGVGKGTLFRRFGDRGALARALISDREARFQEEILRGEPPIGPGAPPVDRIVAFGLGLLRVLDAHAELVYEAEFGRRDIRFRGEPYASYRRHLTLLVGEADPEADADYLADVLLASLSADLFLYLRRVREMPLGRIETAYEHYVRRVVPS